MKLTVHFSDPQLTDETYEIGKGHEYRTWYWNCSPTLVGTELASLIIKRWCHPGCRVEIPRERISSVTVDTHAHTENETNNNKATLHHHSTYPLPISSGEWGKLE